MPDEAVGGRGDEHEVTPVELFFDLVFVFAITQVTRLFVQEPTWLGLLRGMLVLAAVWWAWNAFAWLTSAENIDEGGVRLAILGTTALMLGVALAVPRAFARDAILFAVAYFLVRSMHAVLSLIVRRDDSESREALLRFIPTALIGASILVIAALVGGDLRIALWIIALLIDYSGPAVIGMGQGWAVAPEHFAERYGLIILIALGESVVAIGVAANFVLNAEELLAAALGMVTVSALWWLYFDVGALFVRRSSAPCEATITAASPPDGWASSAASRAASYPAAAATLCTARAIGEEPTITTRAAGSCGSRKISSEPPLRHGLCSITAPSSESSGSVPPSPGPSPGTSRNSSGSPVSSARKA